MNKVHRLSRKGVDFLKIETEKVANYQFSPYIYNELLNYKYMVTFNFTINKKKRNINSVKDIPSKYDYSFKDLERICVYFHYYNDEELPFYVGQGTISRAFNFNNRNNLWKNKVKDASKVKVVINKIDISIEDSITIEKELIAKYKCIENGGCLVNGNEGDTCIGKKGNENYFYNKHFIGKENGNYGNKYELNPNSKPVLQIDILGNIVKEWASATEAEEIGHFYAGCIADCCSGKRNIHKGYQWIYKNNYDTDKNYEYMPGKTNNRIYIGISLAITNNDEHEFRIFYGSQDLRDNGFTPKNVSQVINGTKKSHKGYVFVDFFKLDKKYKEQFLPYIDIDNATKI